MVAFDFDRSLLARWLARLFNCWLHIESQVGDAVTLAVQKSILFHTLHSQHRNFSVIKRVFCGVSTDKNEKVSR